jgi:hypothetical protein
MCEMGGWVVIGDETWLAYFPILDSISCAYSFLKDTCINPYIYTHTCRHLRLAHDGTPLPTVLLVELCLLSGEEELPSVCVKWVE